MATMYAKRINHGQSAIRIDEGESRVIATNAIRNAIQRHCDDDTSKNFWGGMPGVGTEGALTMNVDSVAAELGLV